MIQYKTDRQKREWESNDLSWRLRYLVEAVARYSFVEFKKEIVITDLIRTQEEQDEIYKNNVRYQESPWKSVHQFGRGCDLRTSIYTVSEIEILKDFANFFTYDKDRPKKQTCLVHDVGVGLHFHLQVNE